MSVSMIVSFPVVVTVNIRIKRKFSRKQSIHRLISVSRHSAIKTDSRFCQCVLSSCSNSSTDKRIHIQRSEYACQGAVTAAICTHNLRARNLTVLTP